MFSIKKSNGWEATGLVIHDAKQILEHCLEWRITHVPRVGNGMAHSLAKLSLSLN